jgi:hypothetical protein
MIPFFLRSQSNLALYHIVISEQYFLGSPTSNIAAAWALLDQLMCMFVWVGAIWQISLGCGGYCLAGNGTMVYCEHAAEQVYSHQPPSLRTI